MADLVVGLAKSVVEGALTRAQSAIEEEAKLRQSAQRDLVFITGEFEMMHSFLSVAKVERVENEVVRTWVRQVRELAYDVEDCIEFVVHIDKTTSWWFRMIPSWCLALPLPLDEAVDEIEQLKARVEDVSTRNTRYSLISDTGSKPVVMQQQEALAGAAVAATKFNMLAEARGATKRKQRFGDLTQLITKKDSGLQVISVWGSGCDHGTTSVIRKTYNHQVMGRNFTYLAWVKLKHPFVPRDFVLDMMAQFYANSCKEEKPNNDILTVGMQVLTKMKANEEVLFVEFERLVTQERYLLVLEGLSNMVEWDAIRAFLPDTNNGSWIIVSTPKSEMATLCIGHSYKILELRKFSDEHSVCALFKASQGDGDKDEKPMGSNGSEPKADEEIQIRDEKLAALKAEANEWMSNHPLVGRESRMNELAEYPVKARINPRPVMSVWGIAGVGKSALVKHLFYDRVLNSLNQYDDYYWVDVSHPFNIRDLYLTLLPDFHSEKDPMEECHRLLKNDRCLIVVDDLRSTKEWDLIQAALVSKHSKSVIIVITTDASIATYCTNNEDLVFNVKALEASSALNLFKTPVFKKYQSSTLQIEDMDAKELILKCGGIPKVIAAIARLLAKKKDKSMETVASLNRRFMHHLETDPEYDVLQDLFGWMHSYFRTCPDSLKPCIFYLSIFPRDHVIRRRRLIRRWIAEGYSRDSHNESAEENGEKHFSELLELSIIQQLSSQSSSVTGTAVDVGAVRMVLCQVNGFIREYIVSRRMEENLVFELGDKCSLTTQRTGRHLVILKNWDRDRTVFKSIDFSRLRSLTVFGEWKSFFISENMKMLRVLDLEDASGLTDADLNKVVEWLRRLKFLSLRGHVEIYHLPGSLDHLRLLETLDIRNTSIVTLPHTITKLHRLQYIRAGTTQVSAVASRWSCCPRLVGVEVPKGIGKLTALHTLGVVNISASGTKMMVKELKKITQLRKLGVSGINKKNSKKFAKSGHCDHLESLSVQVDKGNEGCLDDISLPWLNLRSLKLFGLGDRLPQSMEKLFKLTKLDLEMAGLTQTDIELLGRLPELCILRLDVMKHVHFYVKLCGIEEKSYEKVKILEIGSRSDERLNVTFGKETMRNLELLNLDCSNGSTYNLPGLANLRELKELLLKGTHDETIKTEFENRLVANHYPRRLAVKLEKPSSS